MGALKKTTAPDMNDHSSWMRFALAEAQEAYAKDEVPIGAVIVCNGEIIGNGHNLVETRQDPTAHAEMLAIQAASQAKHSWRLEDCILYTTLEPCVMCAGAILLSRIQAVVFGAYDPRYGACGSALQIADNDRLDVRVPCTGGVLEKECSTIIKTFFAEIRKR